MATPLLSVREQFIADVYDAWEEHGVTALECTALEQPDKFAAICARLHRNVA